MIRVSGELQNFYQGAALIENSDLHIKHGKQSAGKKQRSRMNTLIRPVITALTLQALISACSNTSGGAAAAKLTPADAKLALSISDLANAIYRIDSLGEFRLDKGQFKRSYGEGVTQKDQVILERFALGDLDQDGFADAAVILEQQSGGSGNFKYRVAMRNIGGAPGQQDGLLMGDQVRIADMSIARGYVYLKMLTAGAGGDPACCPNRQIELVYRLHSGKWERTPDPKKLLYQEKALPAFSGIENASSIRESRTEL